MRSSAWRHHPPTDLAAFITQNLPLAPVDGVPGVVLHLAGPNSSLNSLRRRNPAMASPYWAYAWGGGLALARHLRVAPDLVVGRRVLDLGTGSGLAAIAAAMSGALSVRAVDNDPYAIVAAQVNARANAVAVETLLADVAALEEAEADLVLVADLFYNKSLVGRVMPALDRWLATGAEVLVGDPGRADLPRERLQWLADYPVADFGEALGSAGRPADVFRWCPV